MLFGKTARSNGLSLVLSVTFGLALVAMGAGDGLAQCEIPLLVQQNATSPNVLIVMDTSGSMRSPIYDDAYDGFTTYTGSFDTATFYSVTATGDYTADDFLANGDSLIAPLVKGECGGNGRYLGNYMNWVYYHATDAQRAAIPQITRMEVEKAVVIQLIQNNPQVRFGIMRLNGDEGGTVIANVGADSTSMVNAVSALCAGGYTPLAEALVDAMVYFQRDDASAPIIYDCAPSFVIMMTDGSPTRDLNIPAYIGDYDGDGREPGTCASIGAEEPNSADCSDYLDDVAAYIFDTDMRPDLDDLQNLTTYAVGFGIDIPLLQETADNGHGLFFRAENAAGLTASLTAILLDIARTTAAGSAVSVVSAENSANDFLYRAKFLSGAWKGYVEAFALPYSAGAFPVWEAGAILASRDADSRVIYSQSGGSVRDFTVNNAGDFQGDLGAATAAEAAEIITFVRGDDVTGFRDRTGWKLGDIVDSAPLVVGAPSSFHDFNAYSAFRAANISRETAIYVGANDGMLHAFRASDGHELWAYIPEANLGKLSDLTDVAYCHRSFADGSAVAADVYMGGAWKTMLVTGLGSGSDTFVGIDITNPASPDVLWDVSYADIVESWSTPSVSHVQDLGKFVAFVGSGPDATGDATVLALDLADGAILWQDVVSTGIAPQNKATDPALIDLNYDGYDDLMYVADFGGNLWRYDLNNNYAKTLLFNSGRPIQGKPVMTVASSGDVTLIFGTGRYIDTTDLTTTNANSIYAIIDDHSGSTVTSSDLVDQTYTISPILGSDRGWVVDMVQASGERVVNPVALVAGVVYATSFQPNDIVCSAGGVSWLYEIDFKDGTSPDTDDGSEDDTIDHRLTDLDEGIASRPAFDFANEQIIIQNSETTLEFVDAKSTFQRILVQSWRQIYQ